MYLEFHHPPSTSLEMVQKYHILSLIADIKDPPSWHSGLKNFEVHLAHCSIPQSKPFFAPLLAQQLLPIFPSSFVSRLLRPDFPW